MKFVDFFSTIIAAFALSDTAAAAIDVASQIKPRIIGGKEVPFLQRTYVSGVRSTADGHSFCGGTLITPKHVLTAAQCIDAGYIGYASVGTHFLYTTIDGVQVPVVNAIQHPQYFPLTVSYDFLILELAEVVTKYAPLALAASTPPMETIATVAGWGSTVPKGNMSIELLEVDVPIVPCPATMDTDATMMCAGRSGVDACVGDSGGPLVVKTSDGIDAQVGIVSWGRGCGGPVYPGVYARVNVVRAWIDDVVGSTTGNYTVKWI